MFGLDIWQTALFIFLVMLCINYIWQITMDRLSEVVTTDDIYGVDKDGNVLEGFTDAVSSKEEWLNNEDLYDDFYASIYNKIFQHDKLVQAEAAMCLQDWQKQMPKEEMRILDVCSGSGVATCYFAKQGVGSSVGLDKSPAMMRYAKSTVMPVTTLSPSQRDSIEWRQMDLIGAGAGTPAEFTHACMLYFTVYYFRDLETIFRNLALWVKPGGTLCIEVVNKHKFEPIPDVANPWVAISPQRFKKERITKASAEFDKFEYEAEFDLEDPRAEFKETFRFKDGSTRRQKHVLWMPSINQIVERASNAGWTYNKYMKLDMIGFNYGYLLYLTRNPE